jgi:hypothetical protein
MNSGSPGGFTRQHYDQCTVDLEQSQNLGPYEYQVYHGKFEHCKKCIHDGQFWTPYKLVDVESELKNITRPLTRCNRFKYNPKCEKSKNCLSTYDKSVPVVLAPEVCPIVENTIRRPVSTGNRLPAELPCAK